MALKAFADGRLFAQVYGDSPPKVVALHGWGRRATDFDRVLAGLDAVAFDLPGFGASPAPRAVCGSREYAEMLAPEFEGFARMPVVVGHSFGGRVAVRLAGLVPLSGLVLTGVPLVRDSPPRLPSLRYRAARLANRVGVFSDDGMEQLRRRTGSADYRAATGVMRDVLVTAVNESYADELSVIDVPVTMVWGGGDGEVPVSVAERASAVIAKATLEVVPGVGHHVPLEAPERLRAAIEELLAT